MEYFFKSLHLNLFNFVSQVAWTALTKWQRSWRSFQWMMTRPRVQRTRKKRWRKRRKRRRLVWRRRNEPRNVASYGSSTCHFPLFYNRLKMKNWTLVFFLASISQDLGATLNASISQSLRCCELLSHSQSHIALHFPIHCGPVIMYCVFTRHAIIQGLCYWLIPTLGNLFSCFSFVL